MDPAGALSPDHLEYSLDGMGWRSLSSHPATVARGKQGAGWQEWTVLYRLQLHGDEAGGEHTYTVNIVYSVTSRV